MSKRLTERNFLTGSLCGWLALIMLSSFALQGQEADDGSQAQRSRLLIGNGLQGGDLVALSLIEPDENKVELTVMPNETPDALRDRLVLEINASAEASQLVTASVGGAGEVLLTGKTKGLDIAVYFDTSGADVLKEELIHRAVPPNEEMIPGYITDSGYSNEIFAVNVVHQGEWFLNADPGHGGGTILEAEDGNYSSEIEDGNPLSIDASGWAAGIHRVGLRFSDEFGDWSGIRWFHVEVVDPASVEAEPEGRPEETDLTVNSGFSPGDAYLVEVNGTEYRYVVGADDNISDVRDGLHQVLIAGDPGVIVLKIGQDGLRLTGTGYQTLGIQMKYEGGASGATTPGQSARAVFPLGHTLPVTRNVGGAEYFVGSDPGEGNGTVISAEDLQWDEETEGVNLPGLDPSSWSGGDERIGFRFVDDLGRWGPVWWHEISVFDPNSVDADPASTAQTDTITLEPGFQPGDWYRVTIDGVSYDYNVTSPDLNTTRDGLLGAIAGNPKADATALPGGIIRLTGKTPGESYLVGIDGNSSNPAGITSVGGRPDFPTGTVAPVTRAIGGAEYFLNDPNASVVVNPEDLNFDEEHEGIVPIEVNASTLTGGEHRIGFRFQDDLGRWSPIRYLDFTVFDPMSVDADEEERNQTTELVVGQDFEAGDDLNCTLNGVFVSCTYQPGESLDGFCQRFCDAVNAQCAGFCTAVYLGNGKCQIICFGAPCEITCVGTGTFSLDEIIPYRPSFPESEQMPEIRTVAGAEYFLNDPNASVVVNPEDLNFDEEHEGIVPIEVNASTLTGGEHRIGFRFKDDLGRWSPIRYQDITVFDPTSVDADPAATAQTDTISLQPGFQPGDWFRVTIDGVPYDYNVTSPDLNSTRDGLLGVLAGNPKADATALPGGIIRLTGKIPGESYLVGLDSNASVLPGLSGESGRGTFPESVSPPVVRKIGGAEYFVGNDPGEGGGTYLDPEDLSYDEETEGAVGISLVPTAWAPGDIRVGTRFQDDTGKWGPVVYNEVTVFDPSTVTADEAARSQQDVLTWTNNPNPGESYYLELNGTRIEYLAGNDDNYTSVRDWYWQYLDGNSTLSTEYVFSRDGDSRLIIEGKTPGYSYWVHLEGNGSAGTALQRQQDPRGEFTKGAEDAKYIRLVAAEYFINEDPGPGQGTPMSTAGMPWGETTLTEADVSTLGLGVGEHTLGVRFKDDSGNWSPVRWMHFGLDSLTEGLAGHWMLDDNGSVATDSSGYDRHGTLTDMEINPWELGKIGRALRFEASPGHVDLSDHLTDFEDLNQSTLSMWIKMTSQVGAGTLFGFSDANAENYFNLSVESGKLKVANSAGEILEKTSSLADGDWHLIAFTTGKDSASLYLDGTEVASGPAMPISFYSGYTAIFMGSFPGGNNPYTGLMDDVRMYNRALNSNEAKMMFDLANKDTDGDGLTDGVEAFAGGNPNLEDTDGDGLLDGEEYSIYRTRLDNNDTDGDGLLDSVEIQGYLHQPSSQSFTSDPLVADTDGDGYSDYDEVTLGTDPNNPDEFPNEAPTDITFDAADLYENRPAGTLVGSFSAVDRNKEDLHTFSIIDIDYSPYVPANSPFELENNNTGRLVTTRGLDHEVDGNMSVFIRVSDGEESIFKRFPVIILDDPLDLDEDGLSNEDEIALGTDPEKEDTDGDGYDDKVENDSDTDPLDGTDWPNKPNTPPSDIVLTPHYPMENKASGVLAASISVVDPDKKDFHTFKLVSGNGDEHNEFFSVNSVTGELSTEKPLNYEINPDHNYSIRVEVVDDRGGVFEKALKVPVVNDDSEDKDNDGLSEKQEEDLDLDDTLPDYDGDGHSDGDEVANGTDPKDPYDPRPPNDSPNELILTSDTLPENKGVGTKIGDFVTYDQNPWDKSFAYSLVDGNGSDGNPDFMIDENGTLFSQKVFNYEDQNQSSILVRTTDEAGGYLDKVFIIKILDDSNEDTDNDGLSEFQEDSLGTSDHLEDTDGDEFDDPTEIKEGTDPTDAEDFPIVNAAPFDLELSPREIVENSPVGTHVGSFTVQDHDTGDQHQLTMVPGEGDADNLSFEIKNGKLITRDLFNYERKSSYLIRVMARDNGGLSFEKPFTINVLNDLSEDGDGDGLTEKKEEELGTDDGNPDTDGDGASDGYEVQHKSNPLDPLDMPSTEMGFAWVRRGGAGLSDRASDIVTDKDGNSYVIGSYEGNIEFEGSAQLESSGGSDIFVIKFDHNGIIQWTKSLQGPNNDFGNSISLTDEGHLLVSGTYGHGTKWEANKHTLSIDDKVLPDGSRYGNAFIAMLDTNASGELIWAQGLPSFEKGYSFAADSTFDKEGNAYLCGHFSFVATTPNEEFLSAFNSKIDGFIIKFGKQGEVKWHSTLSGKGDDQITAISVTPGMDIFLGCRTGPDTSENAEVSFADEKFSVEQTGSSFLAKLSSKGELLSRKVLADGYDLKINDLATSEDRVFGVGDSSADTKIEDIDIKEGGFAFGFENNSEELIFARNTKASRQCTASSTGEFYSIGSTIEKISQQGDLAWSFPEAGLSLSTDAKNGIYLCGAFSGTRSFLPYTKTSKGEKDAFVGKLGSFAPNSPPEGLKNSSVVMMENMLPTAVSTKLVAADDDLGDIHEFKFVQDDKYPDNQLFEIRDRSDFLPKQILDFEKKQKYQVAIEIHDGKGGLVEEVLEINVTDDNQEDADGDGLTEGQEEELGLSDLIKDYDDDGYDDHTEIKEGSDPKDLNSVPAPPNLAPTGLQISSSDLSENLSANTLVGQLSALDPDLEDTHEFELSGDFPDNEFFDINGSDLLSRVAFDYETKNKYHVNVSVKDAAGETVSKVLQISVLDVPEFKAPVDIILTQNKIEENQGVNSLVGEIEVVDSKIATIHKLELLTGNEFFSVTEDGKLLSSIVFDYETRKEYPIKIRATNAGNHSLEKELLITITDIYENLPIEDVVLDSNEIAENNPKETKIGTFSATDGNKNDTHSFYLEGDNEGFLLSENGVLSSNRIFNFEEKSEYPIRVRTVDGSGAVFLKDFVIKVLDVPEYKVPADIILTPNQIEENKAVNSLVGKIDVVDTPMENNHSLELVSGNEFFSVTKDGKLLSSIVFDYETRKEYQIKIRATNEGNLSLEKELLISITDIYENLPIEDVVLDFNEIAENNPKETKIGTFSATDGNKDDTHSFYLEGDNKDFLLSEHGVLSSNRIFNFEEKSEYSIRVRAVDGEGLVLRKNFVVKVLDVFENSAPSSPSLAPNVASHDIVGPQVIGELHSHDPDPNQQLSFELSHGDGDDNNSLFKIEGNQLKLMASTNYFLFPQYSIRVTVSDPMNAKASAPLVIEVAPPEGADLFGSLIGSSPPWPTDFVDIENDGIDDRWQRTPYGQSEQPADFYTMLTIVYGGKETYEVTRKVIRGNHYPLRTNTYERGWKFKKWQGEGVKRPFRKFTSVQVNHNQTVRAVYTRSLRGKYVNGYVAGAIAFLDSALDGGFNGVLDDFEPFAMTNGSGEFDLEVSDEQFDLLDLNGNGELDDDEVQIVCTGGTDVSTGLPVSVSLKSPVSSEYVTPLTSILSDLVSEGKPVDQAQDLLRESFAIDDSVDLLNFDSVAEAASGNENSLNVLNASTQVAVTLSLVNSILAPDNEDENKSLSVSNNISKAIASQILETSSDTFNLSTPSTIQGVLNESAEDTSIELDEESTDVAAILISSMNNALKETTLSDVNPAYFKKSAAEIQMASANTLDPTLRKLAGKVITPSQAFEEAGPDAMEKVIDLMVANNSFAPTLNEKFLFYDSEKAKTSALIHKFTASDADEDQHFNFSIISGNIDPDGDENSMLELNASSGNIYINDMDDLGLIGRENLTLEIKVTDDGNLSSSEFVYLVLSEQSMLPAVSDPIGSQWFRSDWLGIFYWVPGTEWVFNQELGWVYSGYSSPMGGWVYSTRLGWLWMNVDLNISQTKKFIFSYERNSWLFFHELNEAVLLFVY